MYKLVVLIENKTRRYLDEKRFVICQQLVNMIGKHDFMNSLRKCAVNFFSAITENGCFDRIKITRNDGA